MATTTVKKKKDEAAQIKDIEKEINSLSSRLDNLLSQLAAAREAYTQNRQKLKSLQSRVASRSVRADWIDSLDKSREKFFQARTRERMLSKQADHLSTKIHNKRVALANLQRPKRSGPVLLKRVKLK